MLTFKGEKVSINYRDDLSGEVIFKKDDDEFTMSGEDLESFIKEIIISRKISQIENLEDESLDEIIGKL